MTKDTITLIVATWGAVLGTVSFAWNVWRGRYEDGRLRVRVYVSRVSSSRTGVQPYCLFEVTNVGRRPAHFGGLILHDKEGQYLDQVLGPPGEGYEELGPGEVCETSIEHNEEYVNVDKILRTHRMFAVDSVRGRVYLSRWRMWKMKRDVQRILAERRTGEQVRT